MTVRLAALHVAALWTIVFVQPLFDLLGGTPGFFVARGNGAADVLALAFGWTLGPPLLALAVLAAARARSERAFRALHLGLIGALTAVLLAQPIAAWPVAVVIPLAAAAAAGLTALYARTAPLKTFVSQLGLAPPVVLALFLASAPVADVLFPPDEADAAATEIGNPKPVVLLVFDELPTVTLLAKDGRRIDAERFPNFARLARTSTWYPNATSVADGTYVAVPAIFTGEMPEEEIDARRTYDQSVFTLLGRDYDLHVHEPMTVVCPTSLCGARDSAAAGLQTLVDDLSIVERRLLLPDDLADDLPAIDRDVAGFAPEAGADLAVERLEHARRTVETIGPTDKPGLWVVHHVIPHVPWEFLADGTRYATGTPSIPGLDDQTWGSNPFLIRQAYDRHVQMTRFADRLLAEVLDRVPDNALLVVVADHGVAFGPGRSRRPVTEDNFAEVAGVPFFVRQPGQTTGSTSDRFVTTLDVLPIIAATLRATTDFTFAEPARELRARNGRTARFVTQTRARFRTAFAAAADARPAGPAGPRRDLVGTDLRALDTARAQGRATLETTGAYVSGTTEDVAPGTPLILAVDGIVTASAIAYEDRFSFFLDRPPDGPLEILEIRGRTARRLG